MLDWPWCVSISALLRQQFSCLMRSISCSYSLILSLRALNISSATAVMRFIKNEWIDTSPIFIFFCYKLLPRSIFGFFFFCLLWMGNHLKCCITASNWTEVWSVDREEKKSTSWILPFKPLVLRLIWIVLLVPEKKWYSLL